MAIFKRKKDKVVDLSGRLEKHRERTREKEIGFRPDSSGTLDLSSSQNSYENSSTQTKNQENSDSSSSGGFFGSFFGGNTNSNTASPSGSVNNEAEERRKKLTKRILDMTNKIEELENEMFRMKQRLELVEKKQRLDY
jgi:TolA-binding protein